MSTTVGWLYLVVKEWSDLFHAGAAGGTTAGPELVHTKLLADGTAFKQTLPQQEKLFGEAATAVHCNSHMNDYDRQPQDPE